MVCRDENLFSKSCGGFSIIHLPIRPDPQPGSTTPYLDVRFILHLMHKYAAVRDAILQAIEYEKAERG